ARAFVELLRRAGVRVAVLGNDEPCCGDPARRIGHELLYDQFARSNIEILRSVAPRRITTACPHCLNALGTEYRAWGGDFDVVHHSALLAELVEQGRLAPVGPGADPDTITYHDPCYLGRYGGQFDAPRRLLDAAGATRVEMPRHRSSSFCCGGGGGQSWMPAGGPGEQRINVIRAREAAATGATTLAVSCPFCIRMLEDGVKAAGPEGEMRVRDVAEVLLDSLGPAATGSAPPRPGTSDPVRRAGDTRH
ncbi:MAG: (Fe-S)-binding protein, partial [Burkholderiales bacterium]|nr:(Fe-S)-binding protein [Burkholderiales bacterium]